ncbi:MAG: hypothetical protein K0R10_27, partial [Alphaproteobacteria bacterium]|nr:hypothetical protein [Alphaproteobacteria bacterium]
QITVAETLQAIKTAVEKPRMVPPASRLSA